MKHKGTSANETGLLEYLEEIIGTNVYKEDIEKLDKEHETIRAETQEKKERVRISEKDLENLHENKNQAISFVKTERELFQLRSLIHQINKRKAQNEVAKNVKSIEETQNQIQVK